LRIGIVGTWLVLVAILVRQQWSGAPPPIPLPQAPADAPETDEWMGVYHGGQKIGYAHLSVTREADGYRFRERSLLRLTVMDTRQTVHLSVDGHTDADFALRRIRFELANGDQRFRAQGEVDGPTLRLRTRMADSDMSAELPTDGPIFLPTSSRRRVAAAPAPGQRFESLVFNPAVMKHSRIITTVVGEEAVPDTDPPTRAWRLTEQMGEMTTTAWVDEKGRVMREEGPLGIVLRRETARDAVHANWSGDTTLDLVASAAILVSRELPDARERRSLQLRLGGVALENVPADERQRLDGDVLTVEREEVPASAGYELPYAGADLQADLASSPLLQSDHPRVQGLAAEVVAGERRPVQAAEQLVRHVYERLRKVPSVTIPNSLQVLEMGEGDCNEHAVLLAALARAAGLPARAVAGVVYIDGAFYYHAWNEVWLGSWVSADAALGQFPADATHIKLVTGGPEDHLTMVGVMGRLTIEVLS
jgi:hypothetical protein